MSLNYVGEGYPIAIIKGTKTKDTKDTKHNKIYLADTENEKIKSYDKIALTEGTFQPIPNTKRERDVGLIIGASGSGKSTYCKNWIIEYHKIHKTNPIYLISHLDSDKTLDDLGYIQRIQLGIELLEDPLTIKDFSKCLIIFDDVEIITDKRVKKVVYQLLDETVMTGRHFNVSCLMVSHSATGLDLKRILNECHTLTYFPWGQNIRYTLEKYIGLDIKQIRQIKATKSRWCTIIKNYPQCAICEKNIFVLSSD
jgi:hypothetical protein